MLHTHVQTESKASSPSPTADPVAEARALAQQATELRKAGAGGRRVVRLVNRYSEEIVLKALCYYALFSIALDVIR